MINTLTAANDHMEAQAIAHGNIPLLPGDDPYQTPWVPGQNCTFETQSSGTSPHTGVAYHLTYQVNLNAIHGLLTFLNSGRHGSAAAIIIDPSIGVEECGTVSVSPIGG